MSGTAVQGLLRRVRRATPFRTTHTLNVPMAKLLRVIEDRILLEWLARKWKPKPYEHSTPQTRIHVHRRRDHLQHVGDGRNRETSKGERSKSEIPHWINQSQRDDQRSRILTRQGQPRKPHAQTSRSNKDSDPTLVQNKFGKCLQLVSRMGCSPPPVHGVSAPCHPQAGGALW